MIPPLVRGATSNLEKDGDHSWPVFPMIPPLVRGATQPEIVYSFCGG